MMALWMAYGLLVSLLLCAAARAAESALRTYRWPVRFPWLGAIAGSILAPAGAAWLPPWSPFRSGGVLGAALAGWIGEVRIGPGPTASAGGPSALAALDEPLLALWLAASLALLVYFGVSYARLRMSMARWPRARCDGTMVYIAPRLGPAVAGLFRGAIVMPAWAMRLEPLRRSMILAHEREHLRAGDQWLLALGLLALALTPWNLPLWWAVRRLRRAVELDCDRRVLAGDVERAEYGQLLLEVGWRSSRLAAAPAMFAEGRSFLERRVQDMFDASTSCRLPKFLAGAAAALVLVAAACETPSPADGSGKATPAEPAAELAPTSAPGTASGNPTAEPVFTPFTVKPEFTNREEAVAAVAASYPELLKDAGVGGSALVWLYIDATGVVKNVRLNKSSGRDELDAAALKAARTFRFTPAKNGNEPVAVWVAIPVKYRVQ